MLSNSPEAAPLVEERNSGNCVTFGYRVRITSALTTFIGLALILRALGEARLGGSYSLVFILFGFGGLIAVGMGLLKIWTYKALVVGRVLRRFHYVVRTPFSLKEWQCPFDHILGVEVTRVWLATSDLQRDLWRLQLCLGDGGQLDFRRCRPRRRGRSFTNQSPLENH